MTNVLDSQDSICITQTKEFIKKQFLKYPHFSFGNGLIMYHHSVLTQTLALQIVKEQHLSCDRLLVSIGALLHDIGKTKEGENEETLHRLHESFNLPISESFVDTLTISAERLIALKNIISYKSDAIELMVIKDADTLALANDKDLYMLYISWAVKNNLYWAIKRKYKKYERLHFPISKALGAKAYTKMKLDWEKYIATTSPQK